MNMRAAAVAAALVACGAPLAANAVTVRDITEAGSGAVFTINPGDRFDGQAYASGGPGEYFVTFEAGVTPLGGKVSAVISLLDAEDFENIVVSWVDAASGFVLDSAPVTTSAAMLETLFTEETSRQNLQFRWDDSLAGTSFEYDVAASPVPLPAAAWMLVSAVAGLGYIGRRRQA